MRKSIIKISGMLLLAAAFSVLGSAKLNAQVITKITCPTGDEYKCYTITIGTPEDPDAGTQTFRKGEGDATIEIEM